MKDYAKRNSSIKNNINVKKTIFRSKKKSASVVSSNVLFGLLLISSMLAVISFTYFDTDIKSVVPRENLNNITIDFPTSLIETLF